MRDTRRFFGPLSDKWSTGFSRFVPPAKAGAPLGRARNDKNSLDEPLREVKNVAPHFTPLSNRLQQLRREIAQLEILALQLFDLKTIQPGVRQKVVAQLRVLLVD